MRQTKQYSVHSGAATRPGVAHAPSSFRYGVLLLLLAGNLAGLGKATAQTCVPVPDGAVAWWPFDETTGTTADEVIGRRLGVHTGGATPAAGHVAGGVRLDGVNDYVGVVDDDVWAFGGTDFTIEFWANLAALPGGSGGHPGDVFISSNDGGGSQRKWFFAATSAALEFHVNGPGIGPIFSPVVSFAPNVGQWQHYAVTRSGTLYSIYLNGALLGSGSNAATVPNASSPLFIGQSGEAFGGFLNGVLDEMTIYNRRLSGEEVAAIASAGAAGKCKTLQVRTSTLGVAELGKPYSQRLTALFGTPPFTWSVTDGAPPAGISLTPDGLLSGVPEEAGTFNFTVQVADGASSTAERSFSQDVSIASVPADLQIALAGTILVPGRKVDVFTMVENKGSAAIEAFPVQTVLMPWHSFLDGQPPPDEEVEIPTAAGVDPFLGPGHLVRWTVPPLAPGAKAVLSFSMKLNSAFPLDVEHSLDLCWWWEKPKPPCKHLFFDRECYGSCVSRLAGKDERDCNNVSPPGDVYCWQSVYFECTEECTTCRDAVGAAARLATAAVASAAGALECGGWREPTTGPIDPNEKLVLAKRFIPPGVTLVYPIHFENIGKVEAQDVFIRDVLDANIDLASVEFLTPIGASFETQTRTVKWDLLGVNLPAGESDSVLFAVRPLPGLPSGAEIRNSASIQFEGFTVLPTNEVVNVIDSTPPECVMAGLPGEVTTLAFPLSWQATDSVGEVEAMSVFVSRDGGPYVPLLEDTTEVGTTFVGEPGRRYDFVCVARDTARNAEVQAAFPAEATTVVKPPVCRVPLKSTLVLKNQDEDKKDTLTWNWTKGDATTKQEFGTPTVDTSYNLLIQSAAGPFAAFFVPPGALWKDLGSTKVSKGFKYADKRGMNSGVTKVALKPGVSKKAAVIVNGKGVGLELPPLTGLASPVSVRLENAQTGTCWEAVYDNASKATPDQWKAEIK